MNALRDATVTDATTTAVKATHLDDAKAKLVDRHEEACHCETCKLYA